jgi:hypothetical protein
VLLVSGDGGSHAPSAENRRAEGGGIKAAKLLWRRLKSADFDLLVVGQVVVATLMVYLVIRGMMNASRVTQSAASSIVDTVWAAGNVLLAVLIFHLFVQLLTREREGIPIAWVLSAAAVGINAATASINFAVQVMVVLARDNHTITLKPAQSELAIKDLYRKAVYDILDTIPILKIPASVGWEDPITHFAALGGIIFLLLKLIVIVIVARIFVRLWVAVRKARFRHRIQSESSVYMQEVTDVADELIALQDEFTATSSAFEDALKRYKASDHKDMGALHDLEEARGSLEREQARLEALEKRAKDLYAAEVELELHPGMKRNVPAEMVDEAKKAIKDLKSTDKLLGKSATYAAELSIMVRTAVDETRALE